MTNPTATEKLIRGLESIDKQFLPILHQQYLSPQEHIHSLLALFQTELGEDNHGILAVNPLFYEITDWRRWKYDVIRQYPTVTFVDDKAIRLNYLMSQYIAGKTKGFTETLLYWLNYDRCCRGGLSLNVRLGDTCKGQKVEIVDDKDKSVWRFVVDKNVVASMKRGVGDCEYKKRICPYIIFLEDSEWTLLGLGEDELYARWCSECSDLKSFYGYPDGLEKVIAHHALYLNEKVELFYFLSNSVFSESNSESKDMGLGGLFVLLDEDVIDLNADEGQKAVRLFEKISNTLSIRIIHHYYNKERKLNAKKAALSAVMSRNMSHNIGSHVLVKLSNKNVLESEEENISKFNSYLRTRMDFIADMVTGLSDSYVPMLFYGDCMRDFKYGYIDDEDGSDANMEKSNLSLLMDYISGSSIKENDIIIIYKNKGVCINDGYMRNDVEYSSPNGLLGVHAMYIIFENLIRNYAKHNNSARSITLWVDIKEEVDDKGLMAVTITDDSQNAYKVINGKYLYDRINDMIEGEVLDDDLKLRKYGWGLLEMKTAAAYLRGLEAIDVDDKDLEPKILRCLPNKNNDMNDGDDNNLSFKFYLKKVKRLLIVIDDSCSCFDVIVKDKGVLKTFNMFGVDFIRHENIRSIHDHSIVMYESRGVERLVTKNSKNRYIAQKSVILFDEVKRLMLKEYSHDGVRRCIIKKDIDDILASVYRHWYVGFNNPKVKIYCSIDDGFQNWVNFYKHDTDYYKIINRDNEIEKNDYLLARHGYALNLSNRCKYYESIEGNDPMYAVFEHPPDDENNKEILMLNICDSVFRKVIVIDERIQEDTCNELKERNDLGDKLSLLNISVPTIKDVDLYDPDVEKIIDYIKKKIMQMRTMNEDGPIHLIIHLGILEKLFGYNEAIVNGVDRLNNLNDGNIDLILTTGRGSPPIIEMMQNKVRLIQYSSVYKYLVESVSKYHLMNIIYSSRRRDK